MKKIQVPVKIIDKRIVNGILSFLFGSSYCITIKPTDILERTPREYKVAREIYYDLGIGEEILLSFVETPRGTFGLSALVKKHLTFYKFAPPSSS
jgi:hypothetical protein